MNNDMPGVSLQMQFLWRAREVMDMQDRRKEWNNMLHVATEGSHIIPESAGKLYLDNCRSKAWALSSDRGRSVAFGTLKKWTFTYNITWSTGVKAVGLYALEFGRNGALRAVSEVVDCSAFRASRRISGFTCSYEPIYQSPQYSLESDRGAQS